VFCCKITSLQLLAGFDFKTAPPASHSPKPNLLLCIVRAFTGFTLRLCVRDIWLSASCGHNSTVLWLLFFFFFFFLALREVLEDKAEVSQAVFEWGQGEDSGLIGRVQLEDGQQPPAPRRTVGRGLQGVNQVRKQKHDHTLNRL